MSVASDLRSFLLADATLTGLVGLRVHPAILPQSGPFPAITYQWTSGTRYQTSDGPVGLSRPRIQLDCWAETYLQAEAVFEALRRRLDGFVGVMGGSPGTPVQGVFFESERDGPYEPEAKLYRRSADFFVFFEETV